MRFAIAMLIVFLTLIMGVYPTGAVDNNKCFECHGKKFKEASYSTMKKGPHTKEPDCVACHYNHAKVIHCGDCHHKNTTHNLSCIACHTGSSKNLSKRIYEIEKEILIKWNGSNEHIDVIIIYKKVY